VIFVPSRVVLSEATTFLTEKDWVLQQDARVEIGFEGGDGHVEPWALTALCAYALACKRHDMTIAIEGVDGAAGPLRMGVMRFMEPRPGRLNDPELEPAGRYIPLRWVLTSQNLALLFADVVPLLHLADAPEQAKAIQYCVSEMVRNVLEHSRSDDGAIVAAERYPEDADGPSRVSIAVADGGIGIRRSMERNYEVSTDAESILTAVKPGTTGAVPGLYGTTENAGAGLFFTRRMARTTGGRFAVISGDALFLSPPVANGEDDEALLATISPFPGTVIAIEVGTETRFDLTEFLADAGEAFYARSERASRRSGRARFT
jgi:hypothetical protein